MERDIRVRQSMRIALCRAVSFLSYGACAALGEYRWRRGTSAF